MGFDEGTAFLRYINEHDKSKTRWDNLETGAFVYWYRGSPRPMAASDSYLFANAPMIWIPLDDRPPVEPARDDADRPQSAGPTDAVDRDPSADRRGGGHHSLAELGAAVPPRDSTCPNGRQSSQCGRLRSHATHAAAWTGSLVERPISLCGLRQLCTTGRPDLTSQLIGPGLTVQTTDEPYQTTAGSGLCHGVFFVLLP